MASVYFRFKEGVERTEKDRKRLDDVVSFAKFTPIGVIHLLGKDKESKEYRNLWRGTKDQVYVFIYSMLVEDRQHFEVCALSAKDACLNILSCDEFLYRVENKISLSSVMRDTRERNDEEEGEQENPS